MTSSQISPRAVSSPMVKKIQIEAVLQHQVGDEHLGDARIRQGLGRGREGRAGWAPAFFSLWRCLFSESLDLLAAGGGLGGAASTGAGAASGLAAPGAHPSFQMEAAARFCAMGVLLAEGLIGDNVYWRCR